MLRDRACGVSGPGSSKCVRGVSNVWMPAEESEVVKCVVCVANEYRKFSSKKQQSTFTHHPMPSSPAQSDPNKYLSLPR